MLTMVGITDTATTCDACGREDLRATYVLRDESANFVFYGSECATRAVGRTRGQLTKEALSAATRSADARELLDTWSRFIRPDGTADVAAFLTRNPTARRGRNDAELSAYLLATVDGFTAQADAIPRAVALRLAA